MPFTQNQNLTCLNQPQNGQVIILPADAQALKVIYVGGPNGSKVVGSILAVSDDTSPHDVQIGIMTGGTVVGTPGFQTASGGVQFVFSTTTVAAAAGNAGSVPPANLMPAAMALDSDGQPYFFLQAGEIFYALTVTTLGAGKQMQISALAIGDF